MRPFALKMTSVAAVLAALSFATAPALAMHDLPAGDVMSPVASDFPAGFSTAMLLAQSMSTIIAPGNAFTGTFRSAVYANVATAADAMNPGFVAGQGVLDFVYQFSNAMGSQTSVARLSFFDFALGNIPNQFAVLAWDQAADVDGPLGTLFVTGVEEAQNAERGINGSTISLNYGAANGGTLADKIDPGESSFAILLRVNTTNFTSGFFSAINGTTATAPSFAPVAAIPEPETYALMLAGLGALGFVARRRRKA